MRTLPPTYLNVEREGGREAFLHRVSFFRDRGSSRSMKKLAPSMREGQAKRRKKRVPDIVSATANKAA